MEKDGRGDLLSQLGKELEVIKDSKQGAEIRKLFRESAEKLRKKYDEYIKNLVEFEKLKREKIFGKVLSVNIIPSCERIFKAPVSLKGKEYSIINLNLKNNEREQKIIYPSHSSLEVGNYVGATIVRYSSPELQEFSMFGKGIGRRGEDLEYIAKNKFVPRKDSWNQLELAIMLEKLESLESNSRILRTENCIYGEFKL